MKITDVETILVRLPSDGGAPPEDCPGPRWASFDVLLVRLSTDELAVVTAEHPSDPFRPQVKVITTSTGEMLEEPELANTWERDFTEHSRAVVEAVDPEPLDIDPLKYL